MLCIKCIIRLHVSYGLWIRWVISHAPYSHCRRQLLFSAPICHAGETEIFSSSVILVCQTLSAVFIQNWMIPLRQIRDVITSSVSFTFRENEFAADNKASLPFQSLFTIFIFLCCFFVSVSEIETSPGWFPLIGWTPLGYTSTHIDP